MELLLAVMDDFPFSIIVYDENSNLLLVNKETKKLLGYQTESWIGKNRWGILGFILEPNCLASLGEAKIVGENNKCTEYSVSFKNKDGIIQTGKIVAYELRDKIGEIKGYLDLITYDVNIMGNKDESENMSEIIQESIDIGIMAVDNNLAITSFNKQAEKVTGKRKQEVIGKNIRYLYPNDPYEYQFIQRTLLEGKEFKNAEEIIEINGSRVELIVDTNLLRNKDDQIIGAVCICKDITDFRRIEKEIEKSERLRILSELFSGVAHEIRNPLAGIKGFLQLLENNCRKGLITERNLFYIESILEEIDRINNIIKEFLLLNKNSERTKISVNINELIENVINLMETLSLQKSIRVEKRLDYSLTNIYGHSDHLKQIFINLIKNSIEALEVGGNILIKSSLENGEIKVEIIDDGPGILPEIMDKIIYPFFTTKAEGTGLGLSICKKIIREHGGRIIIESIVDGGTTVKIYLPTNK